jgi:dihydrofolate reductase
MAALFLIVARAQDGTIGDDGTLAWHIPPISSGSRR